MADDSNNFKNLEDVVNGMKKGLGQVADLSSVADKLKEVAERSTEQQVLSKGARAGTPWKQLAPNTVTDRLRKGFSGDTPLVRRGDLLEHLKDDTQVVISNDGKQAEVGYSEDQQLTKIAGYQSAGTKNIPARPLLGITEQDVDEIAEELADEGLKKLADALGIK